MKVVIIVKNIWRIIAYQAHKPKKKKKKKPTNKPSNSKKENHNNIKNR